MRRPASFSLLLALALLVCTACPSPTSPTSSATPGVAVGATCEFFGTRFVPFQGWNVQEHREAGEPLSRVSLDGYVGAHHVLVSIIPREMRASAESTSAGQSQQYFRSVRSGMTDWTDVNETRFDAPARSYPVMFGRRLVRGALPPLDTQQDDTVLLYFPDDFPAGRYFYVFFWTDIRGVGEKPNDLEGLRTLVDSFEIKSAPVVGAASRGCA